MAITMILAFCPPIPAGDCECDRQLPDGEVRADLTPEEIGAYVAIFRGKATAFDIVEAKSSGNSPIPDQDVLITFDVLASWKGVTKATRTVRTPFGAWQCGFQFLKRSGVSGVPEGAHA